jgi:hypothetical protein
MARSLNSMKEEVFGFIAAMRTLLDNYPELQKNDQLLGLLNANSPLAFLLGLAEIIGLSKEDLLNWVSKILCGAEAIISNASKKATDAINGATKRNETAQKIDQGILDAIEIAIKAILLTNVKNLFTCSINPLIPYDVLKYPNGMPLKQSGQGIKLSIPTIDMFNVLQHAPNSDYGKTLYFDNAMPSKSFWQSTDFNCFMWYVINKGTTMGNEGLKHTWDNRVKYRKKFNSNDVFRNNFFDEFKGNGMLINTTKPVTPLTEYKANEKNDDGKTSKKEYRQKKKSGEYIEKKSYIILEYNENDPTLSVPNTLTMYLNADRYLRKIGTVKGEPLYIPKTVFEFNYDYIFSLKLFDSKVIVANIINSIIGITNSASASLLNVSYTLQQEAIAGKVGQIVKEVMEAEDTVINDDFFSFSNDQYETLLDETDIKYSENYHFGEVYGSMSQNDVDNITKDLNSIGNAATLNEQETIIKNIFTNVSATAATNGEVSISDKFTLGGNIIFDLIKESITQIVLQVLSPKVMMLYAVNSYFMGDAADGDFSKINVKELLKGLTNLIISIVKQVLEMLLKELLSYLLNELKELLNALLRKIILERIEYYLEILQGILNLIKMFYNAFTKGKKADSVIDNVNYADIVPPENNPT